MALTCRVEEPSTASKAEVTADFRHVRFPLKAVRNGEGEGAEDFPDGKSTFPVTLSQIPCSDSRDDATEVPESRAHRDESRCPTGPISRISLYFSLLAGNLGRRLVRTRLRRQPTFRILYSDSAEGNRSI